MYPLIFYKGGVEMKNTYQVKIMGDRQSYYSIETANSSKIAVIQAIWKITKPIFHNSKEDIRRLITYIQKTEIVNYINRGGAVCTSVDIVTGEIEYYAYRGKIEKFIF